MNKLMMRVALCLAGVPLIGFPFFAMGQTWPATHNAYVLQDSRALESSSVVRAEGVAYPDDPGAAAFSADPAEPAEPVVRREYPGTMTDVTERWTPFSRIGLGSDISPLGIGIKSATVLTEIFDARVEGNFYSYGNGNSHVSGINVDANIHLASVATKLDWYPGNGGIRLSPGIMLFNGNDLSAKLSADPGTSFSINNQTYFSAKPNAVTGAVPLNGNVDLSLHSRTPAFTLSGGFGRYIPRSHRHWSFPFEIGAIFTGAPKLNVNVGGWVCKDYAETQCSNLSDPTNPIAVQFNNNLNLELAKYRRDLSVVTVYPIFSYGVMYSFNTPW